MRFRNLLLVCTLISLLPYSLMAQQTLSFDFEGTTRTYILYQPAGYVAGESLPLVMAMHGFTQSATSIMNYSGFNAVADSHRFFVVYPSGIGNAWNTNSGFPGGSTANDVGFLSALIDTMHRRFQIDTHRVYATGFSAGGFMSQLLACELGSRITAVASVAGTMSAAAFNDCTPAQDMPVLHIHGTSDAIVSYNGGFSNIAAAQLIDFWRQQNGCAMVADTTLLPDVVSEGSTVRKVVYADCTSDVEVWLYDVLGGGHTWPGAAAASGLGNTNRDINASEEIWAFFSRFTRAPDPTGMPAEERGGWHVYPNPASEFLHLQAPDEQAFEGQLQFVAATGQVMWQAAAADQRSYWQVPVQRFPAGLYWLHWQCGDVMHTQAVSIVR